MFKPKIVKKGRSGKPIQPVDGGAPNDSWLDLCPELSKIISVPVLKYDNDVAPAAEGADALAMRSVPEMEAEKALQDDVLANKQVKLSRTGLVRVYPSDVSINSENMVPMPLFSLGAQLVSMNYQTHDINYHVYQGFFRQNGSAGYVEKPATLCDAFSDRPYDEHTTAVPGKMLSVTVISGQQLTTPGEYFGDIIDPYVVVGISGKQMDCTEKATRAIDNNAFNPYWREAFEFQVRCPDIAMFYVVAVDDTQHRECQLGQFACPVRSLRPGYDDQSVLCVSQRGRSQAPIRFLVCPNVPSYA